MRKLILIWVFACRAYHLVGNLMHWFSWWSTNNQHCNGSNCLKDFLSLHFTCKTNTKSKKNINTICWYMCVTNSFNKYENLDRALKSWIIRMSWKDQIHMHYASFSIRLQLKNHIWFYLLKSILLEMLNTNCTVCVVSFFVRYTMYFPDFIVLVLWKITLIWKGLTHRTTDCFDDILPFRRQMAVYLEGKW